MTSDELLRWIADYEHWVYGLLLAYALAKTGPLPMVAGYLSFSGELQTHFVWMAVLAGTLTGGQARFAVGRWGAPWLFNRFERAAPWIALGAVAVERFGAWLLPLYRFSKGTYTLVGLGAGASMPSWRRFTLLDGLGGLAWASVTVGLGVMIGQAGAQVDPRWAAYVGLSLLVLGIVAAAVFGRSLRRLLLPRAEQALAAARQRRAGAAATTSS
jgi:membrane protein DedA with SNARE-associated domain